MLPRVIKLEEMRKIFYGHCCNNPGTGYQLWTRKIEIGACAWY